MWWDGACAGEGWLLVKSANKFLVGGGNYVV